MSFIVLDVYQDLFGSTISLHGTLKKAKVRKKKSIEKGNFLFSFLRLVLTIYFSLVFQLTLTDSDKLQLGVCNAYKVDKLKRFKNKSLPTMIFCSVRQTLLLFFTLILHVASTHKRKSCVKKWRKFNQHWFIIYLVTYRLLTCLHSLYFLTAWQSCRNCLWIKYSTVD